MMEIFNAEKREQIALEIGYGFMARLSGQMTATEWQSVVETAKRHLGLDSNPNSDCVPVEFDGLSVIDEELCND